MERQTAVADELAHKVDYVRDWLNKAEAAIRRGDKIDAVIKLSLAKADTTNLISNLAAQPSEVRGPRLVASPGFAWRKLALLVAPFALIGCFLLGLTMGGVPSTESGPGGLNTPIPLESMRSVERPFSYGDLVAMVTDAEPQTELRQTIPEEEPPVQATPPRKTYVSRPVVTETPVSGSKQAEPEPVVATPEPEGPTPIASADEPLNLFNFGLDVIRSARQNLGR